VSRIFQFWATLARASCGAPTSTILAAASPATVPPESLSNCRLDSFIAPTTFHHAIDRAISDERPSFS
jgi:hypothetical protein